MCLKTPLSLILMKNGQFVYPHFGSFFRLNDRMNEKNVSVQSDLNQSPAREGAVKTKNISNSFNNHLEQRGILFCLNFP